MSLEKQLRNNAKHLNSNAVLVLLLDSPDTKQHICTAVNCNSIAKHLTAVGRKLYNPEKKIDKGLEDVLYRTVKSGITVFANVQQGWIFTHESMRQVTADNILDDYLELRAEHAHEVGYEIPLPSSDLDVIIQESIQLKTTMITSESDRDSYITSLVDRIHSYQADISASTKLMTFISEKPASIDNHYDFLKPYIRTATTQTGSSRIPYTSLGKAAQATSAAADEESYVLFSAILTTGIDGSVSHSSSFKKVKQVPESASRLDITIKDIFGQRILDQFIETVEKSEESNSTFANKFATFTYLSQFQTSEGTKKKNTETMFDERKAYTPAAIYLVMIMLRRFNLEDLVSKCEVVANQILESGADSTANVTQLRKIMTTGSKTKKTPGRKPKASFTNTSLMSPNTLKQHITRGQTPAVKRQHVQPPVDLGRSTSSTKTSKGFGPSSVLGKSKLP